MHGTMLVKRDITVKIIVTDEFKRKLIEQLRGALRKVELTRQQLDVQGKRYLAEIEDRDASQADQFRRKLEDQMLKQESLCAGLTQKLAEAEKLNPGDEYSQGKLESFVEIGIGDNLAQKLQETELIVKDDLVVDIRCI